jgi:hypothetical protein
LRKYFKTPICNDIVFIAFCPDIALQRHQDLVLLGEDRSEIDIGNIIICLVADIKCQAAGKVEGEAGFEGVFCGRQDSGVEMADRSISPEK